MEYSIVASGAYVVTNPPTESLASKELSKAISGLDKCQPGVCRRRFQGLCSGFSFVGICGELMQRNIGNRVCTGRDNEDECVLIGNVVEVEG